MKTLSSLLGALALTVVSVSAHADLLGETLTFQRLWPDISTQYGPAFTQPTVTVVAGDADNTSWIVSGVTYVTAMPESSTITLSFVPGGQTYGDGTFFDGYGITGFSTSPSMASVASNTTGLTPFLTFTSSAIYVNLVGSCSTCPGEIVLDLSPVPEASTWALFGLGLIAVGFSARRRRAG